MNTETDLESKKMYPIKIGSYEIEMMNLKEVTLTEHLQALSVFINLFLTTCGALFVPVIFGFLLLYTRWWFMVLLYMSWIYYDRQTGFRGGRKLNWCRKLPIFKLYRDYFPVRLIKTAELPPDNNYLLVMYPHGVIAMSVLANFATEANNIESEVFPGIDVRIITLDINFYSPITRDYFMVLGGCAASESSISYLLKSEPSKAVVLVAGGASEAGLARPGGTYSIIISRRKGFVRIALKHGVPLVPVFSFGENNVYEQYNSKWISFCQDLFLRLTGIRPIIPKGRGFFQNTFGCLPKRRSINTVVGKPIPIPKIENPSKEQIDEFHKKYVEELHSLFEENKHKYDAAGSEAKLIML